MKPHLEERFHELLVLDCKGEASPEEQKKLAILERMRNQMTPLERQQLARLEWHTRTLRKLLGGIKP